MNSQNFNKLNQQKEALKGMSSADKASHLKIKEMDLNKMQPNENPVGKKKKAVKITCF